MTNGDDLLPCGHTKAQGAWLGCDEKRCRSRDEMRTVEVEIQEYETRNAMDPPKPRK